MCSRSRTGFISRSRMVGLVGTERVLQLVVSLLVSTQTTRRRSVSFVVRSVVEIYVAMSVVVVLVDFISSLVGNPRSAELDKMARLSTVMENSAAIFPSSALTTASKTTTFIPAIQGDSVSGMGHGWSNFVLQTSEFTLNSFYNVI